MLKDFFRMNMWRPPMSSRLKKLYEEGYRGVIFDIDNTLVPTERPRTDAP